MSLIALSGKKESGKSTVANYLVSRGYKEITFAEPLTPCVVNVFCIDTKYVTDQNEKNTVIPGLSVTGRELMQTVGTELFRSALATSLPNITLGGHSVWVRHALERIAAAGPRVVVSDCRFDDEYAALKAAGFHVYRINRPGLPHDAHASEKGCPYDTVVDNDSSIEDLLSKFFC